MKRILSFLWRGTSSIWDSTLAPTTFGCLGALLLVIAGQAILPIFASKTGMMPVDDSPAFTDVDMLVALTGFIAGLAIWYWMQSRNGDS